MNNSTQNKKVPHIIVATSYFYPKIGGVENYSYLLAKTLHESGEYRVSVVTSNHEKKEYKQEVVGGMVVHRLPIAFKISNTPLNLMWYSQIKEICAKDLPDLVHVHAPVPGLPDIAAKAAGHIPVVVTYHAGSMLKNKFPIDIIIGMYEQVFLRSLFKRVRKIVTISDKIIRKNFPHYVDKMTFIPTGVDLVRFTKTALPPNTEVVTFVGRIEHSSSWKGVNELLQAFVLVLQSRPQARLELAGGGDAVEFYKEKLKELGIAHAVTFLGPLLGQDLVHAYQRAQVVVLPSTSDAEAFSITLVEAMASGRPIIATNIGGNPQVVEEGKNGLLVPPQDIPSLAQAIVKVLSNKKIATDMADYGAAKAQSFSWTIRAKQYSELFQEIL